MEEIGADGFIFFCQGIILKRAFFISKLIESMSFHHIGIGKFFIWHDCIVARLNGFVKQLLFEIATCQSEPIRGWIRILVYQLVIEHFGFILQTLCQETVGCYGQILFFLGIFFQSPCQPWYSLIGIPHINIHIGYVHDVGQVLFVFYGVKELFRFIYFAFA